MLRSVFAQGRQKLPTSPTNGSSNNSDSSDGSSAADEEAEEEELQAQELEPWHVWAQRVTRMSEEEMNKAGVPRWACPVRQQIWQLACHISRRSNGRRSMEVLDWTPEGCKRSRQSPPKRWAEDIAKVFEEEGEGDRHAWRLVAACRDEWRGREEELTGTDQRRQKHRKTQEQKSQGQS